jgi:enoyl-CoA hydratase
MGTLAAYRLEGAVATITLDDGKVNVMSPRMLADINAALDRAAADRAAIVLTGRPGIFSAGFDLATLRAGGAPAAEMVEAGFELAARVLSVPAPVVMACPGHAIAMGLFLLLSGDYLIGADGPYKFTANEVALGITMPRTAIEMLRHRLTPAACLRALTLAEPFTPATATAAGFLDEVVAAGELASAARDRAAALAALPRDALAASKQRIRAGQLRAVRAAIAADRDDRGGQAPVPA